MSEEERLEESNSWSAILTTKFLIIIIAFTFWTTEKSTKWKITPTPMHKKQRQRTQQHYTTTQKAAEKQ